MNTIFLGIIGPWQIAIVVLALLLLFGGKKIPELMKGLAQGMNEFKKAKSEMDKEDEKPEEKEKK